MTRIALIILFCLLGATTARAQDELRACEALMCDNGAPAYGEPGFCKCGEPEPVETPEPIMSGSPTCERDFACIDGNQVGYGTWPYCGCLSPESPRPTPGHSTPEPGSGLVPSASLGGGATCAMFFTCAIGEKLVELNGGCFCDARMLTQE